MKKWMVVLIALFAASVLCNGCGGKPAVAAKKTESSTIETNTMRATEDVTNSIDLFTPEMTRKQGSKFQCWANVRLSGRIRETPTISFIKKLFDYKSLSEWHTTSSFQFESEVLRHNATTVIENWTVGRVQALRLMGRPGLLHVQYNLGPEVKNAILAAGELAINCCPNPVGQAGEILSLAVVTGQDLNWAPFAKVFGVDQKLLEKGVNSLGVASKILRDWEQKTATLSMKNGRVEWGYTTGAVPPSMEKFFSSIGAIVDYSLIPTRRVRVGDSFNVDRLMLTQLVPPMFSDLPEYEFQVTFTRRPDRSIEGRNFASFDGNGRAVARYEDGSFSGQATIKQANLLIDITDHDNVFVSGLQITAPVDGKICQEKNPMFKVEWDGLLEMRIDYQVGLKQ